MRIHDNKPKIYIAVPTYSGKPWYKNSISILQSILGIQALGWECRLDYLPGDCMIHSVRNKFVAEFMSSDCTHLFFIDDDVAFDPVGLIKLVKADRDVVTGFVPIRQGGTFTGDVGPGRDGDLIELYTTGAAFLCIKKNAIRKMFEKYPELKCKSYNSYGRNGYSLFDYQHTPETMKGEDITFCKRWLTIGKIWGMPGIKFEHLGEQVFEGSYDPALLKFGMGKCA